MFISKRYILVIGISQSVIDATDTAKVHVCLIK